jgi:hypothetical protein
MIAPRFGVVFAVIRHLCEQCAIRRVEDREGLRAAAVNAFLYERGEKFESVLGGQHEGIPFCIVH